MIVAYIPYLEQLLYPDKFAENLALFRSNCVALQMHCYVPDFVKEPADTLEPLYIGPKAAEGHFSELGSAKFAKFLIGVLHKEMQESDTSS